jgi:hypothetical protein
MKAQGIHMSQAHRMGANTLGSRRFPVTAVFTAVFLVMLALLLTGCQTGPVVRTQSAPELDALRYQTFGFVEHPDTDKSTYTTLTTRYLKEAVTREMLARGYTQSDKPDLLVNFFVASKDKVEGTTGPALGVGYSRWGFRNWGWGVGYGGGDVRPVTDGTLTVDVVDGSRKAVVWSGSAQGRLTKKVLDHPQPAIDDAVTAIFAKYPKPLVVASTSPK